MPASVYEPNLAASLPPEVLAAAKLVSDYFAEQNVRGWRLYNCADRLHFADGAASTASDETYDRLIARIAAKP